MNTLFIIQISHDPFTEKSSFQKFYLKSFKNGSIKTSLTSESAETFKLEDAVIKCSILNKTSKHFYRPIPNQIIIQSKLNDLD